MRREESRKDRDPDFNLDRINEATGGFQPAFFSFKRFENENRKGNGRRTRARNELQLVVRRAERERKGGWRAAICSKVNGSWRSCGFIGHRGP